MGDKTFYMVFKEGGGAPTKKHETEIEAIAEAERLCGNNSTNKFYVCKSTCVVYRKPQPITIEETDE